MSSESNKNLPPTCSARGMLRILSSEISYGVQTGLGGNTEGTPTRAALQPGTAEYVEMVALGGTMGAVRGTMAVGEEIVSCVRERHRPAAGPKPQP